jgi:hypothetical protein
MLPGLNLLMAISLWTIADYVCLMIMSAFFWILISLLATNLFPQLNPNVSSHPLYVLRPSIRQPASPMLRHVWQHWLRLNKANLCKMPAVLCIRHGGTHISASFKCRGGGGDACLQGLYL